MPVRIGIVDDNASNRNILKNKLLQYGHFEIKLTAEDGNDFLSKMKDMEENKRPAIVLMDLEMPGMDGVEAIGTGSFLFPGVKFVVLTIFDDEDKIFKAIKAGASGYLLKDESAENIAEMLWQMHESGAGPISPGIAFKILQLVQNNDIALPVKNTPGQEENSFALTPREKEILTLLVKGMLYKHIGNQLGISPNTAKKHVINIYNKLHVKSRAEVIHIAHRKNWI